MPLPIPTAVKGSPFVHSDLTTAHQQQVPPGGSAVVGLGQLALLNSLRYTFSLAPLQSDSKAICGRSTGRASGPSPQLSPRTGHYSGSCVAARRRYRVGHAPIRWPVWAAIMPPAAGATSPTAGRYRLSAAVAGAENAGRRPPPGSVHSRAGLFVGTRSRRPAPAAGPPQTPLSTGAYRRR
ncbi:Uncharacterised protein [Anaerotruncus sp. 2789STDY5834896]|uniref:Uncharacterized protein n=1 Tax=uncultured Anaerotruncus sp. TaxID=905011 RepID=A0A1C6GD92_9FIRM|nr:Uncharacterised protein [uncultured Anaerotruncus sp.]